MTYLPQVKDFEDWRQKARRLLSHGVPPALVQWNAPPALFAAPLPAQEGEKRFTVPPDFIQLARAAACHRSGAQWDLLYQLLFRLTHGEPFLLRIATDSAMRALHIMEKSVRRDAHKMKAFVRFRRVQEVEGEYYIAWHEPDHLIVQRTSPFFARRFAAMRWSILTPDASAHWDEEALRFGPGADRSMAPGDDQLEDLWRSYYRATFNPARIKIKAMKREMPVRYWKTLPETEIIAPMLAEAPARVEAMLRQTEGSIVTAADYLPAKQDLPQLRKAAMGCEGCELFKPATQTVFGEGAPRARLMIIGEQPGSEEDKLGRPFMGPAGAMLGEALAAAGLSRDEVYITNAVKHFRFRVEGSFRLHQTPLRRHVHACKPWLVAEIAAVKPEAILCLGNTAARALLGPGFTMKTGRGQWHDQTPPVLATYHPSAILRAQDDREQLKQAMADDIRTVAMRLLTRFPHATVA